MNEKTILESDFLKQNWFKIAIIIVAVVVFIFIFYWFSVRHSMIREKCAKAVQGGGLQQFSYSKLSGAEERYLGCLRLNGLEK